MQYFPRNAQIMLNSRQLKITKRDNRNCQNSKGDKTHVGTYLGLTGGWLDWRIDESYKHVQPHLKLFFDNTLNYNC